MDIATASLLDEGTAAAEAMAMFHRLQAKKSAGGAGERVPASAAAAFRRRSTCCAAAPSRSTSALEIGDPAAVLRRARCRGAFGLLLQYPDDARVDCAISRPIIERAHAAGVLVAVATDLLALDAHHAARRDGRRRRRRQLAAVRRAARLRRAARGVFRDARGVRAAGAGPDHRPVGRRARPPGLPDGAADARAAHPAREGDVEHLHRAGAAGQHGGDVRGLSRPGRACARSPSRVHDAARARRARADGARLSSDQRAPTSTRCGSRARDDAAVRKRGAKPRASTSATTRQGIGIALDETVSDGDAQDIVDVFAEAAGKASPAASIGAGSRRRRSRRRCSRSSEYLTHPVFNSHHSETQMMRYIRRLERKDVGLDTSMIPLGSCTMKLNAASEMMPVTWPEFARDASVRAGGAGEGYAQIFRELEAALCRDHRLRRRLAAAELRRAGRVRRPDDDPRLSPRPRRCAPRRRADPVVGARHQSGERGDGRPEGRRRRVRQPTATSTSPTCARKAQQHRDALAALMVTYPSTHGVFEEEHPRDLRDRARARRPGLHGRREHERAGRADQPGGDRRRRLPPEPAQDVRDSARRRRSRHGADRRGEAPRAVSARPSGRRASAARRRFRPSRRRRGAARASC